MKKTLTLNTGAEVPLVGLGTWKLQGTEVRRVVRDALSLGYRHIDTADRYGNHADIGTALDESGIAREEIFLTTKLWLTDLRRDDVYRACQRVLQELKTEYIDLYLIHWPDRTIPLEETLSAMDDLRQRGMVKAIGVSNFTIHHLKDALATGVKIAMNQVEFHPSLYQKELKAFCDENGIGMTAYSPIGQGKEVDIPVIQELAEVYSKSPAQIILNWITSKNIVAIPKATQRDHLAENLASLDFSMSPDDHQKIDELGIQKRLFSPQFADFDY